MTELSESERQRLSSFKFAVRQRYLYWKGMSKKDVSMLGLSIMGDDIVMSVASRDRRKVYSRCIGKRWLLEQSKRNPVAVVKELQMNCDRFMRRVYENGHPKQSHV